MPLCGTDGRNLAALELSSHFLTHSLTYCCVVRASFTGCYFLKFGRKGIAHERLIRLSPDNRYVEWETSFFSFKPKEECCGEMH
jgi:hypothetical protein